MRDIRPQKPQKNTVHHRITEEGMAMGRNAARIADLGYKRLQVAGLINIDLPTVKNEMCISCAAKLGSVPNGCLQTQMDFLKAVVEGKPFLCHSPLDGKLCAGWLRARKAEHAANPLPKEVKKLIDEWEYSPPDTEP